MRFFGIVSHVFLNYANDLHGGYSAGHADHPVPFRDTQQLIMHREAISETFNPTQTDGIVVDANRVSLLFTIYN